MVYIADKLKASSTSMPYVPQPLNLLKPSVDENASSDNQPKSTMSVEQEEEDFIKNNYVTRTLLNEPELPAVTW